jgi:hypothetical protein
MSSTAVSLQCSVLQSACMSHVPVRNVRLCWDTVSNVVTAFDETSDRYPLKEHHGPHARSSTRNSMPCQFQAAPLAQVLFWHSGAATAANSAASAASCNISCCSKPGGCRPSWLSYAMNILGDPARPSLRLRPSGLARTTSPMSSNRVGSPSQTALGHEAAAAFPTSKVV